MIGFHPTSKIWFCDLNCMMCQGKEQNNCIVVGMFSLRRAQFLCYEEGKFLYEFMQPAKDCFWRDNIVGSIPGNFPVSNLILVGDEAFH